MRAILRRHWLFVLLLCGTSIFFIAGIGKVPFHPDESTFLYMSGEFDRATSNPFDLAWDKSASLTPVMRYRMIDAPLTRYLVGFSLAIFELPALENDWDWSISWQNNLESGAFPESRTLLVGRLTVASLFPLSLILLYLIGLKLNGRMLGIAAVVIFSLNPLILLHTRRAMAEGVLVFAVLLVLYALLHANQYPFLAGLAVGLAFNAKHSAGLLVPLGLLAACWISLSIPNAYRRIASNFVRYSIGFGLLTLLLNPFLWRNPIDALQTALAQRQELIERQITDFERIAPAQVLDSTGERAAVAIAQVFIAPPLFSETGNYVENTAEVETAYLESFGSQIGRQTWVAGLLIGCTLLGLIAAARSARSKDQAQRRNAVILLLSFVSISLGIVLLVHLAWQRYYLPLIPFTTIFSALGFVWGIKTSREIIAHGRLSDRLSQILAQFAPDSRVS